MPTYRKRALPGALERAFSKDAVDRIERISNFKSFKSLRLIVSNRTSSDVSLSSKADAELTTNGNDPKSIDHPMDIALVEQSLQPQSISSNFKVNPLSNNSKNEVSKREYDIEGANYFYTSSKGKLSTSESTLERDWKRNSYEMGVEETDQTNNDQKSNFPPGKTDLKHGKSSPFLQKSSKSTLIFLLSLLKNKSTKSQRSRHENLLRAALEELKTDRQFMNILSDLSKLIVFLSCGIRRCLKFPFGEENSSETPIGNRIVETPHDHYINLLFISLDHLSLSVQSLEFDKHVFPYEILRDLIGSIARVLLLPIKSLRELSTRVLGSFFMLIQKYFTEDLRFPIRNNFSTDTYNHNLGKERGHQKASNAGLSQSFENGKSTACLEYGGSEFFPSLKSNKMIHKNNLSTLVTPSKEDFDLNIAKNTSSNVRSLFSGGKEVNISMVVPKKTVRLLCLAIRQSLDDNMGTSQSPSSYSAHKDHPLHPVIDSFKRDRSFAIENDDDIAPKSVPYLMAEPLTSSISSSDFLSLEDESYSSLQTESLLDTDFCVSQIHHTKRLNTSVFLDSDTNDGNSSHKNIRDGKNLFEDDRKYSSKNVVASIFSSENSLDSLFDENNAFQPTLKASQLSKYPEMGEGIHDEKYLDTRAPVSNFYADKAIRKKDELFFLLQIFQGLSQYSSINSDLCGFPAPELICDVLSSFSPDQLEFSQAIDILWNLLCLNHEMVCQRLLEKRCLEGLCLTFVKILKGKINQHFLLYRNNLLTIFLEFASYEPMHDYLGSITEIIFALSCGEEIGLERFVPHMKELLELLSVRSYLSNSRVIKKQDRKSDLQLRTRTEDKSPSLKGSNVSSQCSKLLSDVSYPDKDYRGAVRLNHLLTILYLPSEYTSNNLALEMKIICWHFLSEILRKDTKLAARLSSWRFLGIISEYMNIYSSNPCIIDRWYQEQLFILQRHVLYVLRRCANASLGAWMSLSTVDGWAGLEKNRIHKSESLSSVDTSTSVGDRYIPSLDIFLIPTLCVYMEESGIPPLRFQCLQLFRILSDSNTFFSGNSNFFFTIDNDFLSLSVSMYTQHRNSTDKNQCFQWRDIFWCSPRIQNLVLTQFDDVLNSLINPTLCNNVLRWNEKFSDSLQMELQGPSNIGVIMETIYILASITNYQANRQKIMRTRLLPTSLARLLRYIVQEKKDDEILQRLSMITLEGLWSCVLGDPEGEILFLQKGGIKHILEFLELVLNTIDGSYGGRMAACPYPKNPVVGMSQSLFRKFYRFQDHFVWGSLEKGGQEPLVHKPIGEDYLPYHALYTWPLLPPSCMEHDDIASDQSYFLCGEKPEDSSCGCLRHQFSVGERRENISWLLLTCLEELLSHDREQQYASAVLNASKNAPLGKIELHGSVEQSEIDANTMLLPNETSRILKGSDTLVESSIKQFLEWRSPRTGQSAVQLLLRRAWVHGDLLSISDEIISINKYLSGSSENVQGNHSFGRLSESSLFSSQEESTNFPLDHCVSGDSNSHFSLPSPHWGAISTKNELSGGKPLYESDLPHLNHFSADAEGIMWDDPVDISQNTQVHSENIIKIHDGEGLVVTHDVHPCTQHSNSHQLSVHPNAKLSEKPLVEREYNKLGEGNKNGNLNATHQFLNHDHSVGKLSPICHPDNRLWYSSIVHRSCRALPPELGEWMTPELLKNFKIHSCFEMVGYEGFDELNIVDHGILLEIREFELLLCDEAWRRVDFSLKSDGIIALPMDYLRIQLALEEASRRNIRILEFQKRCCILQVKQDWELEQEFYARHLKRSTLYALT